MMGKPARLNLRTSDGGVCCDFRFHLLHTTVLSADNQTDSRHLPDGLSFPRWWMALPFASAIEAIHQLAGGSMVSLCFIALCHGRLPHNQLNGQRCAYSRQQWVSNAIEQRLHRLFSHSAQGWLDGGQGWLCRQ